MTKDTKLKPDENKLKEQIAHDLSKLSFQPISTDIVISEADTVKLPFDLLPSLGVGFGSLPETFRTITQTASSNEQLFRAITPVGATLKQSKNGFYSSAAAYSDGTAAWSYYEKVNNPTVTIPYNPATLAMAVALAQINQKLDKIQKTTDELFDYLRIKDKAKARASLEILITVLNEYKFNWNNSQFKKAKYDLIQKIDQDTRQYIIELRAQISKKSQKERLFELRNHTEDTANEILDLLKEYKLSIYIYSFSAFLEIMLLENYDSSYLRSKINDIEQEALKYRHTYTDCFNSLEERSSLSFDKLLLEGVSTGIKGIGKLVNKTPIGKATELDESIIETGSELESFNSNTSKRITKQLVEVKDPAVIPFINSIKAIDHIYNQPFRLLVNKENIFVVFEETS